MKNIDYKIQALQEGYRLFREAGGDGINLREYVKMESQFDPGFFGWLFEEWLGDFGIDMSSDHREEFDDFLFAL